VKKLFLVGAALAALIARPAMAADMRVKAPVYQAPPAVVSWTGFYVGANVGYGWEDSTVDFAGNNAVGNFLVNPAAIFPGATALGPVSFKSKGVIGGVQTGYNWQLASVWLIGFETDFNWSGVKGDGLTSNSLVPTVPLYQTVSVNRDIAWYGTIRARLGWLAAPNVLVYGTAGFAYGRVRENVNGVLNAPGFPAGTPVTITSTIDRSSLGCFLGSICVAGASSRTAPGWTAGGGAEIAVTPDISVKAEYLYVRLDGDAFAVVGPPITAFPNAGSFTASYDHVDLHTVRIGLNYRLGGPVYRAY
jgi:outer membrane immunogenic protein